MKVVRQIQGACMVVQVSGRLDATWAEHLLGVVRDIVREGHHQVRLDAAELEYLSSAGIRALLRIRRDLAAVNGSFGLVRAAPFVQETLRISGLEALLLSETETPSTAPAPAATPSAASCEQTPSVPGIHFEHHALAPRGKIVVRVHAGWRPWQALSANAAVEVAFPRARFGLGIGAAGRDAADARDRLGEFVAAAGYVTWLPGDGAERPDYLEETERFAPRLQAVQALVGEGEFSQMVRFGPESKDAFLNASDLFAEVLRATQADTAAMVGLVEVEGLVGVALARSPSAIQPADRPGEFPEVRDWLAFCGERVHRQAQALVVAFISCDSAHPLAAHLSPMPSRPELRVHAHAAALAFHALPQGVLDLATSVRSVFEDNVPLGLLHLIEDTRPAVGLGQSAFIRGACWCGPAQFSTEALA